MTPHGEWRKENPEFISEDFLWLRWEIGPFSFSLCDFDVDGGDFYLVGRFGEDGTKDYCEFKKPYTWGCRYADVRRDGFAWAMEKCCQWMSSLTLEMRQMFMYQ